MTGFYTQQKRVGRELKQRRDREGERQSVTEGHDMEKIFMTAREGLSSILSR
jgi:hypothetical protein